MWALAVPPLDRARLVASAFTSGMRLFREVSLAHCEVAQLLAQRLGFDKDIQRKLLQAFERWDGRGVPNRLKGEQISLPVRVIEVAYDAEIFHRLGGTEAAIEMTKRRAGGALDPAVVEGFARRAPELLSEPLDAAGHKQLVTMFRSAFPDWVETVEDVIAEGDKVVVRVTGRGTHEGDFQGIPPAGKRVSAEGVGIARIENGRIVEAWAAYDALGLMQQIGAIPSPGAEVPG